MMVTDFTSMFHESGFVFVNEFKSDIALNNARRVERQRISSKVGHSDGKGASRRETRSDDGSTSGGATSRRSGANAGFYETVPKKISTGAGKQIHDRVVKGKIKEERDNEARRQRERSAKKQRAKHESAELGFEII